MPAVSHVAGCESVEGAFTTERDGDISRSGQLVDVTIVVPVVFGSRRAEVAGDFTAWRPVVMRPEGEGSFSFVVRLERDRRWRYWLRLDGAAWINDPAADDYVRYADGSAVSVLET